MCCNLGPGVPYKRSPAILDVLLPELYICIVCLTSEGPHEKQREKGAKVCSLVAPALNNWLLISENS